MFFPGFQVYLRPLRAGARLGPESPCERVGLERSFWELGASLIRASMYDDSRSATQHMIRVGWKLVLSLPECAGRLQPQHHRSAALKLAAHEHVGSETLWARQHTYGRRRPGRRPE